MRQVKKVWNAYMRKYYADHPELKAANTNRQRIRCQAKQVWIYDYLLEHPCVDCGEPDPLVLEFDHVRGKKKHDVTGLLHLSLTKILKEIAKCDVVCANDHRRRTAQRANTIRWQKSQEKAHV